MEKFKKINVNNFVKCDCRGRNKRIRTVEIVRGSSALGKEPLASIMAGLTFGIATHAFLVIKFKCLRCDVATDVTFDYGEKGPGFQMGGGRRWTAGEPDDANLDPPIAFAGKTPKQIAKVYNLMPMQKYNLLTHNCQDWEDDFCNALMEL